MTTDRREHRYAIRFDGRKEVILTATPGGLSAAMLKRWPTLNTARPVRSCRIVDLTTVNEWVARVGRQRELAERIGGRREAIARIAGRLERVAKRRKGA